MKEKIKKILALLNQWKVILMILLIGSGLFCWYGWRPARIKKECSEAATQAAVKLMKTKAEILKQYRQFAEKDLFLKDDMETYYKECLRKRGLKNKLK